MATRTKRNVSTETPATEATQSAHRSGGPSLNRVSLIGRLTAVPELWYTTSGTAVTRFRLACNGRGEAQFHTVVAWRRLAEVTAEHLAKGRLVYVGGHLGSRDWTGRDRVARDAVELVAEEIQFLTPKPPLLG